MSGIFPELDWEVPPLRFVEVVRRAEAALVRMGTANMTSPRPLDVERLVDYDLQREGIDVYAVDDDDLPQDEAVTILGERNRIQIKMRASIHDTLYLSGPSSNRAKSTLAHEAGHAFLHGRLLRFHGAKGTVLRRVQDRRVKPFRSAEWQAFAFGGVLLMPVSTMRMLRTCSPSILASTYGVSHQLAEHHLSRVSSLDG